MKRKPAFRKMLALALFLLVAPCSSTLIFAQETTTGAALKSWIAIDAPPGWEHLMSDALLKISPDWHRDVLGNLILRKGTGNPRRVVACALDRPGFAVTEITEAGYLRMREAGAGRQHPLWVQFHEGQRITVLTRNGSVPGVVTVKSTHLQRGRVTNAPLAVLDDLWIDVGASSRAEVRRLGIQMLDPIVRDFPSWSYGDFVAGPSAGARVGCASVASVAQGNVSSGETIFMLTTLRSFGHAGLAAALKKIGTLDELTLVDQVAEMAADVSSDVVRRRVEKPSYLPEMAGINTVHVISPKVRFPGSLVESVKLEDAEALHNAVAQAAGVESRNAWIFLPHLNPKLQSPVDPLTPIANLLKTLADVPAVSGHEREVRETISGALPAWAKTRAVTDSDGNLIVEVGPDRDPVMFIAHQDEVGFEITSILDDGTVSLRTRGGLFQSLWEGQTALLHFDRGATNERRQPLQGVFVPREVASSKQPEALTAWFGVNGAELKRLGVKTGQSVTSDKHATRLAATKFTARALDDRAGGTALLLAANRIVPGTLNRRVILAWSTREETGLEGATALAKRYGISVKRVFSIDTFVSSDSPMENTRFAFSRLGDGAVVRGLDNSAVAAPGELDRIVRIAATQGIPLQVGATNGGTDGSTFVPYGAVHVSLSWPGRYSHSPVEVLDLRDVQSLVRLVYALAVAP